MCSFIVVMLSVRLYNVIVNVSHYNERKIMNWEAVSKL